MSAKMCPLRCGTMHARPACRGKGSMSDFIRQHGPHAIEDLIGSTRSASPTDGSGENRQSGRTIAEPRR